MSNISKLEPKEVFYWFEKISEIPRQSKNEKKISDYIKEFCTERNIGYIQDDIYNLIIFKEAAPGYEDCDSIILQGHLDMVCEKTAESNHNFNTDKINIVTDGDFIKAKDTTLGADNGIAVAMILALLDKKDYLGPKIEAILTVDEEEGMGGAEALDLSMVKGKSFINLDSEEGGIFYVSSAGGILVTSELKMNRFKSEGLMVNLKVDSLLSGHSGADIEKERGNANKILGRLLYEISKQSDIRLINIRGGNADNVITKEAHADFLIDEDDTNKIKSAVLNLNLIIKDEYKNTDKEVKATLNFGSKIWVDAFDRNDTDRVISLVNLIPYGVQNMSTDIEGLVETSVNLGVINTEENHFTAVSSIRSSVESRYKYLASQIENLTVSLGGNAVIAGEYPAWEYNPNSKLIDIMVDVYEKTLEEKPEIAAIHAGLECSFFSKKIKDFDCVSIGPWMYDVHTTEERVSISSVEKTWGFLIELLRICK